MRFTPPTLLPAVAALVAAGAAAAQEPARAPDPSPTAGRVARERVLWIDDLERALQLAEAEPQRPLLIVFR